MRAFTAGIGLLMLTGTALSEELPTNPNTVDEFSVEERDFYRVPTPGGENYAFLGDDCYGWWQRGQARKSRLDFSKRGFGYVRFPVPAEDAVLPVFGRLYRVSGKPSDFTSRKFSRITQEKLPGGLAVSSQSMVAPLQREGVGQLLLWRARSEGTVRIQITKIDCHNEEPIAFGKAIVDPVPGAQRSVALELMEGDTLTFDRRHFTVRRIVPASVSGLKTVGWVEFNVKWEQ